MTYPRAVSGLERVTAVHRNGTVALRETTLLAEPGELLAVLGPSGSGKSSMLRAIAGLLPIRSGRVLIGGEPTKEPLGRRDVAMVFEDSHLLPFLNVARNMSFGLDLQRMPPEQSRARVEDQARGLRLSRLLPRRPDTLSRGEQSRVGIGRALVREPAVFLLDEPLAHLDAGARLEMRHHIRDAVARSGVTTIYVTHDQTEALSIGDRIAVLNEGAVVQIGSSHELYDQPVNTFVADFVGTVPIGLVSARLVTSGGMAGYQVGTRTLPTWTAAAVGLTSYRDVLLGLRADDVYEHPQPEHGTVTGMVETLELTGRYAVIGLRVGDQLLNARFDRRTRVRPGDMVTVGIDAARAHVFDPVTKQALAHPPPD